jgi:hypothetical protein
MGLAFLESREVVIQPCLERMFKEDEAVQSKELSEIFIHIRHSGDKEGAIF